MSLTTKQEMDATKRKRCFAAAERRANVECQNEVAVDQHEPEQPQEKHVKIEIEVVDLFEEPASKKKTRLESLGKANNDAKLQQPAVDMLALHTLKHRFRHEMCCMWNEKGFWGPSCPRSNQACHIEFVVL